MAKLLLLLIGAFALQWNTAFTMTGSGGRRVPPPTGAKYPSYPTGNYPSYPTGNYPSYPTGNYPSYPTGNYPSYPTGNYPRYPTGKYPVYSTTVPKKNQTCGYNPCQNGGSCVKYGYSSWYCRCTSKYLGDRCQYTTSDPCKEKVNPCENEGVCSSRKTGYWGNTKYTLSCICPKSHIGPKCQIKNPCVENPCVNGKCFSSQNGTTANYRCQCNGGFEGKHCDIPTPVLCVADKCKNNGICYQYLNKTLEISEAKCYCNGNWGGEDCSQDMSNACQSNPCKNNGACTSGTKGQFYCTCPNGFVGKTCEINDPCAKEICGKHGKCIRSERYINGTMQLVAICACDLQHAGPRCEIVNPCFKNNPCLHGGKCHSYAKRSSYHYYGSSRMANVDTTGFSEARCSCQHIFSGKNCEVLSPCIQNSPCQNGGQCIAYQNHTRYNATATGFRKPYCICPHDFTGKNCENKIVDPCAEEPCKNGGRCIIKGNVKDAFMCQCFGSFTGKTCEEKDSKITSCNFESGLCPSFTKTKTGSFEWLINSGRTRSSGTGPSSANEGIYYIYTEASSPARSGYKAYLRSKFFTTESESCVTMDYHMYGRDIGSLTVKVENSDGEMTSDKEISITGNQENDWFSLELNVQPGTSRISILGVRGKSWAGDIAIDNIVWNGKPCNDEGEGEEEGGEETVTGEPDK